MINKQTSIYSILIALLLLGFLAFQIPNLQFDYELENFFPTDDPDLTYYEKFTETFSYDNDYLLLGFEATNGIFDSTFLSQIDSGLTLTEKLPSSMQVYSPTSLKYLAKTPMGFIPIPLLHISSPSKLSRDSSKLYFHPLYREMFVSKSGKSMKAIVVHERFATKEEADEYVHQIQEIFKYYAPRVRIAGKAVAQTAFVDAVKNDFATYILIALVLIFLWLIVFMRQIVLILTSLFISGLSVVATIGLMALADKKIDVLSSLIPTILLVVSMSNIVHLFSHIRQEYLKTHKLDIALNLAIRQVGVATCLTSFTTAIGFLTLITINVEPIIDLGLYAAGGIILALIITYLLYPSIVALINPKIKETSKSKTFFSPLEKLYNTVNKKSSLILTISTGLFVVSLYGLSKLEIDAYLVNDLPEDDIVKSDFIFFDKEYSGSKPFTLSLWTKTANHPIYSQKIIKELDKIEQVVKEHTQAGDLISPVSMVKIANQNLHRASPSYYKLPETTKQWQKAFHHIQKTHMEERSTKVSTKSLAQITGYFQDLGSKDATLKHAELMKALDNQINHEIIGYRLTGTTLLIDKSHELLSKNLIKGLGIAICIVGIIAGLLFKSWRIVVITLIPNLFPIIIVAAIMGYFSIPLNLSTSVIFAISFGIVVDDTIHFLSQFKYEYRNGKNKEAATKAAILKTGRPILMTTIILSSGFLVFCFSSFSAVYYMGLFVCISFLTALLADLYLLPVLILKWLPHHKK
ncbi:efflux RND transporter permease subunit [Reichenbachiella sp.]|uniref:efflux RND transporter permease subunit n=1 Tax=Reichenbachiella sp. TaxID=2184521 RepID=UPI003B58E17F